MNDQRPAAGKPKRLTPRQVKVLTLLRLYQAEHGKMPTYQELSGLAGMSHGSSIYRIVKILAALGHLTLQPTGTVPAVLTVLAQPVFLPRGDRFYREKVVA